MNFLPPAQPLAAATVDRLLHHARSARWGEPMAAAGKKPMTVDMSPPATPAQRSSAPGFHLEISERLTLAAARFEPSIPYIFGKTRLR